MVHARGVIRRRLNLNGQTGVTGPIVHHPVAVDSSSELASVMAV